MRNTILEKLYEWSLKPYQYFKTNEAWDIHPSSLLNYPANTLGNELGIFLEKNQFQLQGKLESHDVFHVLTKTGITVPEEISMQFYLFGNGKRSVYLFTVIILGGILFPDKWLLFKKAYGNGKDSLAFHQINFKNMLLQPLEKIQDAFLIQLNTYHENN